LAYRKGHVQSKIKVNVVLVEQVASHIYTGIGSLVVENGKSWLVKGKVTFFHTRYRALGQELITVYRESAHSNLALADFIYYGNIIPRR